MFGCIVLYLIAFAFLCWAFLEVYRRELRDRIILTPFVLYCANEVVRVWPAAIYARYNGVSHDLYASLVLISSTLAFLCGYVLFRFSGSTKIRRPVDFWERPMIRGAAAGHLLAIIGCSVLFLAGGFYLYRGIPPGFYGLLQTFTHGISTHIADHVAEQRLLLTKGHHFGAEYRGQGMIRAVQYIGWPLLTSCAFLMYFQRKSVFWLLLALLLLTTCIIYVSGDGTRGPVVWAMLSVLFVLSLETRVRVRNLVAIGSLLLLLAFGLSAVKKFSGAAVRGALVKEGTQRLGERVLVGNGINTIHVIELVRTRQLELRMGDIHRVDFMNALPTIRGGVPFAFELFTLVKPEAKEYETTLASMTYHGKLYGDFGWAGCLVGSFVIGAVLAVLSQFLLSFRKTILTTSVIGITSMQLGRINLAGFTTLFSYVVILTIVVALYSLCLAFGAVYDQRPSHCREKSGANYLRPLRHQPS